MTELTKTESLDKILAEMNMRSKKKRARKKFIKQAMQQLATENQTVAADKPAETKAAYAYDKLPVGFMIKTGKQHFPEEAVFRFYYNQNHPQEYKNKELLTERFQTLVEAATGTTKTSLIEAINQQTSK